MPCPWAVPTRPSEFKRPPDRMSNPGGHRASAYDQALIDTMLGAAQPNHHHSNANQHSHAAHASTTRAHGTPTVSVIPVARRQHSRSFDENTLTRDEMQRLQELIGHTGHRLGSPHAASGSAASYQQQQHQHQQHFKPLSPSQARVATRTAVAAVADTRHTFAPYLQPPQSVSSSGSAGRSTAGHSRASSTAASASSASASGRPMPVSPRAAAAAAPKASPRRFPSDPSDGDSARLSSEPHSSPRHSAQQFQQHHQHQQYQYQQPTSPAHSSLLQVPSSASGFDTTHHQLQLLHGRSASSHEFSLSSPSPSPSSSPSQSSTVLDAASSAYRYAPSPASTASYAADLIHGGGSAPFVGTGAGTGSGTGLSNPHSHSHPQQPATLVSPYAMLQVSELISTDLPPEKVLQRLVDATQHLIRCERVSFFRLSASAASAAQDGESALVCISTTSSRPPTAAYRFSNESSSASSSASSSGTAAASSTFLTAPLLGADAASSDIGAPVSPRASANTNANTSGSASAAADISAQYRGLVLPATTGLAGYVVKTGRAVRINAAVTTDWRYDATVDRRPGIAQLHTVLSVPVRGPNGAHIGVLEALNSRNQPAGMCVEIGGANQSTHRHNSCCSDHSFS
jgi:hypothetical protein